ncbi:MAG TPA: class I SAM-dependent methyltransferase [Allosphingosinicella sp.]|nr:class I SAM-dependent methyltransferase [Allosphingosinicella sp.]
MRRMALAMMAAALAMPVAAKAPARAPADVAAAVAAPGRPKDRVELDAVRKPVEVLRFMGLKRGDRVLDYFTGTGYYAEIMAKAVGPKGLVLGWNSAGFQSAKVKEALEGIRSRTPNFGYFATPATAIAFPKDGFDFATLHLVYHDTYWESAQYKVPRIDPNDVVKALWYTVKPGGTVAVIDHVATPGGDTRDVVEKLHRIDPAVVRADFERAGFVLEAQSNLLRNPADDHSKNVFDPSIRGNTDRFMFRFRKPMR